MAIVEVKKKTVVIEPQYEQIIIETASQGPRGPMGLQGPAGNAEIVLCTEINLGGNRAVTVKDGCAIYADCTLNLPAIGITTHAAIPGDEVKILQLGKMQITMAGFTPNATIYLGVNGILTLTPPTSGFSQIVGKAYTNDTLLIDIQPPIYLV